MQVGWLAREKDRAARIEDFIATLKQLHEDFDWPKPSLDLTLNRQPAEKSGQQQQQESPSYSLQSLRMDTHMGTGDSGYTSLPPPHFECMPAEQNTYVNSNMSSIDSNQNADSAYVYHPDLSNAALQNIQLARFNDLGRISEEGDVRSSHQTKSTSKTLATTNFDAFRREPSLLGETEANLLPLDNASSTSEQVSQWGEDNSSVFQAEIDSNYDRTIETLATQSSQTVCHKLEVKTRYLLQIFTEACCFDFALLLSIILLDAASISRITNAAIRSGSLAICRQLRNGLKDVTRWSFQEW